MQEAIFSAGCFWGVQAIFDNVSGVVSTVVGYTGGHTKNPTYKDVCSNLTGHAEAIKITFDENKVSYNDLLDIFFQSHNPTTLNRQGPDIGTQYRSAVFYLTEEQKQSAQKKIKFYQPFFKDKIVTSIEKADTFYPAEEYHQKYLHKKGSAYCHKNNPVFDADSYYQTKLSSDRFYVMRQKGTEKPHTGKYELFSEKGVYKCGACGQELFSSEAKFNSSCGWPSFDKALPNAVKNKLDFSHFMIRNEVICSRCHSHLGHVFSDGPTQTGRRFCINSIALDFEPLKSNSDKK